jgi:hypothetical protein
MIKPRKLNSSQPKNLARDGASKKLTDPAIVQGQKRQTTGDLAPYHHGVALDDTPNTVKNHEKPVGFHMGVSDKQIIEFSRGSTASQVLEEASNLGRPGGGEKA